MAKQTQMLPTKFSMAGTQMLPTKFSMAGEGGGGGGGLELQSARLWIQYSERA